MNQINCPRCNSQKIWVQRHSTYPDGSKGVMYKCGECNKYFTVRENDSNEGQSVKQIVPEEKINGNSIGKFLIKESEIRLKNDYLYIIKKALIELKPGEYITKDNLLKYCKIPASGEVHSILKSDDIIPYYGITRKEKKQLFGHPDRIKQLINETILIEP